MWILRWIVYLLVSFTSLMLAVITVTNPKYNGKVSIPSKYGHITIFRDEKGIPHLMAENEEASFFGLGYLQAQDRLWQFEKFRRLATGTLSEFFGEEALPMDYLLRQLNIDGSSRESAKKLDPELVRELNILAEGYNMYLNTNVLPIEYYILGIECKKLTYLDLLRVEKFIDFIVSYGHQMELTRDIVYKATNSSEIAKKYMPFDAEDFKYNNEATIDDEELKKIGLFEKDGLMKAAKNYKPTYSKSGWTSDKIFEDVKQTLGMVHFDGSNSWVIHGKHTKSGKPILSTDPHLANQLPCLWLFAEVSYGNYTQAGTFVTGLPYSMMGRSNHMAIGITAIHADVIDLYEETLVDDGKYYIFDGEKLPVKQRKEVIKVRNPLEPSGYKLVELTVNSTHHGVMLHDPFDQVYKFLKRLPYGGFSKQNVAVAWSGFQGKSVYFTNNRCVHKAHDVHEGIECFRNLGTQNLNILLADKKGNIALVPTVSYPIRKHPLAGQYIQDGSKSENDWQGYVPFDELPKVVNPASGYLANSNNMLTSQNVKYGVAALMPSPPRFLRTKELIENQIKAGKKFTAKDMVRMQLDTVDFNARIIHQLLMDIITKYTGLAATDFEDKVFNLILMKFNNFIKTWDADYNVNSTQASLFAIWELEFHVTLLSDQIPSRELRGSMINIPDSDAFLIHILEGVLKDSSFMNEYCPSKLTMFGKEYNIKRNRCLMSVMYNAVYSWNILKNGVSKNPTEWKWGAIHQHFYEHVPFSIIPGLKKIWHRDTPAGGSRRTINFACYDYYMLNLEKEVMLKSLFAANFRAAIDMASFDEPDKYETYMSVDTGASQHPFSPHYFDQNSIHYSPEGQVIRFGFENAQKDAKYKLELIPETDD